MYSQAGRLGLRALRRPPALQASRRWASGVNAGEGADKKDGHQALMKGARKDPELYVLLAIMCGIFSLAGWHFSARPTTQNSEAKIAKAKESEPWKTGRSSVYQYHPGGDVTAEPKDAPSALNVVIVPNVNLPKSLHEQFNKYGKEGY